MDKDEYDEASGVYDEGGDKLFRNTESNGRFHSDWCSMMYPRLVLARNLLSNDGVILISIDDNQVSQLREMCDEIFGESNFICQFIWHSRQNRDNRNINGISVDHEYIVCYSKRDDVRLFLGNARNTELYHNPDNDPRGEWTSANMVGLATIDARPNLHYDLIDPQTGINYGCPPKGWRYDKNTMNKLIDDNRIIWPVSSDGRPRKKSFLNELSDNLPGFSSIFDEGTYTNTATKEQYKIFNNHFFDFPKPVELIARIAQQTTREDSLVLDFFSGSATTAHAVMQLNARDGGKRQFIMVQLPEVCAPDSEAARAGYKNICEIGKERIRRAGEKIKAEVEAANRANAEGEAKTVPDIGFRVLKLDDSNMKDVYFSAGEYTQDNLQDMVSNIKSDRTDMDLLYGCLLDWGLPLSLPHTQEQMDGVTVHTYNDGDLIACFAPRVSEKVVKEIARRQPLRVVFRDSSFAGSPDKINVEEIFKLFAPHTTVKVI